MFFFLRVVALALLGEWTLHELEKHPAFAVLLSVISVVLTIWIVMDAILILSCLTSWAGGR